jgi:predicted DNA-binding protein
MSRIPLNARLPEELIGLLRKQARNEKRPLAYLIELALENYLAECDLEGDLATAVQHYLKEGK